MSLGLRHLALLNINGNPVHVLVWNQLKPQTKPDSRRDQWLNGFAGFQIKNCIIGSRFCLKQFRSFDSNIDTRTTEGSGCSSVMTVKGLRALRKWRNKEHLQCASNKNPAVWQPLRTIVTKFPDWWGWGTWYAPCKRFLRGRDENDPTCPLLVPFLSLCGIRSEYKRICWRWLQEVAWHCGSPPSVEAALQQ